MTKVKISKFVLITSLVSLFAVSSCSNKNVEYGKLNKLGDKLYEVTFNEYVNNYDEVSEYLDSKYKPTKAGCSSIYKNGLFMRNLDWYIKQGDLDVCETLIYTTANEGRYATIGVANNPLITDESVDNLTEYQLKILPFVLTDGMNSEGLMYAQNVCPEYDNISYTCGTNPNGEDLSLLMFGRSILDYCANVDEAIEYVKNHNFYCPAYDEKYLMETHFLVADKNRAVVIEFVDNKMVVLEQENLPYEESFITNHYLYNGGENTGHGMGYERDKIIKVNYSSIKNWRSGMKLLEKLKYSNAYTLPFGEDFWYSEYYYQEEIDGVSYDFNCDTPKDDSNFLKYIEVKKEKYELKTGDSWWSNHSSVYDSNKGTLHLVIREEFTKIYTFHI